MQKKEIGTEYSDKCLKENAIRLQIEGYDTSTGANFHCCLNSVLDFFKRKYYQFKSIHFDLGKNLEMQ